MALTRDQIFKVADEPVAKAIKPMLSNVRKRLGSGSYTTIQEAMAEWKSRRQQASTPSLEPAPAELTERTSELAAEIWTMARAAADLALTCKRQQMEAEQAELRSQAAGAVELAGALTLENDQLKTELHESHAAHERLTTELAEVKRTRVRSKPCMASLPR